MPRDKGFSAQTLMVFAALAADPSAWRHGYDLAGQTGLKSGTLYPILVRLSDRGLLEACWEEGQPAGRPRRHLYRLSADGLGVARAALANMQAAPSRQPSSAPSRRPSSAPARRRLAGESS